MKDDHGKDRKKDHVRKSQKCEICDRVLNSNMTRHKKLKHGIENDVDDRKFFKAKLPMFKKNSTNLTYREMIAHAINLNKGKASLPEITNWIQSNFEYYKSMPRTGLEQAISQNLSDLDAFYVKKLVKNGKSTGFWSIDGPRWAQSLRRTKNTKKKHKIRV